MFTGIVEERGRVRARENGRFTFEAAVVLEDAKVGDSMAVDGCSLTVAELTEDGFTVAVIPHTAEVTTLGAKGAGDSVNVEVDLIAKYVERLLQIKEN